MKGRIEEILEKVKEMFDESHELNAEAEKHLSDGNELEWEETKTKSVEKEAYARGIEYALEKLNLVSDIYDMKNVWRFVINKCLESEVGGIVIAASKEAAEQMVKEKYNYNALEDTIIIWKALLDDDYDKKYPNVLEIYG